LAQEIANIGSWDYDVEKNYIYGSDALYRILGIDKDEGFTTTYENMLSMIHPEDQEPFDHRFQGVLLQKGGQMDFEYRIIKPDQTLIIGHVKAVAKKDEHGKVYRIIGILQDITDQVQTENMLKESQERFENIAENIDAGLWSMDYRFKKIIYASPAVEEISGYQVKDFLVGRVNWGNLIHPDDLDAYRKRQSRFNTGEMVQHQYRIITANREIKWIEDKTFPKVDKSGTIVRLDGIVQDITERKQHEEQIQFYANHDYLTGLPNRRMFDQKLEQLVQDEQVKKDKFALFYLDMDRFKFVNDTLGHAVGDELLREISCRLSQFAKERLVFRFGGDEFTIIQENLRSEDPLAFAEQLIGEMSKPFEIDGYEIHLTTSIGISIFPDNGENIKTLKMNTDAALYRAKDLGKNNVQKYTKALQCESSRRFTLEHDLRKAVQREEFILHYQPKVATESGEIIGAEALIRWKHPKWGVVSPGDFIPIAEETGFINEISDWVIQQVCKQLQLWMKNGYHLVPVSINLSAKSFMKADLVDKIKGWITEYSIPAHLVEIEITENSLLKNEGLGLSTIQDLRNLGVRIAIDDFGIEYSSISYLKKFKADYIKIDSSFISGIHENQEDSTIVQTIIALAKGLGLKVVAEGVEIVDQWEVLKLLECHFIQGFLFSKPLSEEEFITLLKQERVKILPIS